jgi:hypothetical protein
LELVFGKADLLLVNKLDQESLRLLARAISSGVERHVDIVEVGGSRPPSPTNFLADWWERFGLETAESWRFEAEIAAFA